MSAHTRPQALFACPVTSAASMAAGATARLLLLLLVPAVQAPGDEPVWRQVLQAHLDHSDPAVAQAAAAALAGTE